MVRVAVLGAGSSGLAACKACKEEDIEVVCYEKSGRVAGLWNYHEEDVDGEACTMKTTIINSSKEITAFSDFPPPKEFPNYMHNRMMLRYFMMYAETFGLLDCIRYHHEVVQVVQAPDYEETGRWVVTTRNTKTDELTEDTFDGVMVCTGHHGYPYMPKFHGQEDFKGKVIHSHSLKTADPFKNQRVVIVGIGNSGIDAAVDISNVAKQVYLSTRRGTWIFFRVGKKGLPLDIGLLSRWFKFLQDIFGRFLSCAYIESILNSKFDHATYNLKPKHRWDAQHLTINDHLPNKILSGTVIVKDNIESFTEKGVIFEGDESVTKADTVILATGYKIKFPFLSSKILDTTNNQVNNLYKYVFPVELKHPSLAIIGLIQPLGPLFPVFEAQSRWYALLMKKKLSLPSKDVMLQDVKKKKEEIAKRYVGSVRHTVQVDYIAFMDELYELIGAKPNLMKMAFTDPILFYHCFLGPAVSYQYRLQGPHAWPGARRAIIETMDRVVYPLNTRRKAERSNILHSFEFIVVAGTLLLLLLLFLIFFYGMQCVQ